MLLNWTKNLVNGPRFLASGKRFGPYFSSRAEASDKLRPRSELVTTRLTTSACDNACQAVTSLTVLAFNRTPYAPRTRPRNTSFDYHRPPPLRRGKLFLIQLRLQK